VSAECVSYAAYQPEQPFDAVISIGMLEHVVSPEQAKAGEAVDRYRDYFRSAWSFTRPGAQFGLQTIIRERVPEHSAAARDRLDHAHHLSGQPGAAPRGPGAGAGPLLGDPRVQDRP